MGATIARVFAQSCLATSSPLAPLLRGGGEGNTYLVRFTRGGALRAYPGLLSETPSGFWVGALKRLNSPPRGNWISKKSREAPCACYLITTLPVTRSPAKVAGLPNRSNWSKPGVSLYTTVSEKKSAPPDPLLSLAKAV